MNKDKIVSYEAHVYKCSDRQFGLTCYSVFRQNKGAQTAAVFQMLENLHQEWKMVVKDTTFLGSCLPSAMQWACVCVYPAGMGSYQLFSTCDNAAYENYLSYIFPCGEFTSC